MPGRRNAMALNINSFVTDHIGSVVSVLPDGNPEPITGVLKDAKEDDFGGLVLVDGWIIDANKVSAWTAIDG